MTDVDLSEFSGYAPRGPQCSVSDALRELPPAQRVKLKAALATGETSKRISSRAIRDWLHDRKIEVSIWSIDRHRRKECRCDRSK